LPHLRHKAAGEGFENQVVEAIHDRHGGGIVRQITNMIASA
jgi:hypothetical protein